MNLRGALGRLLEKHDLALFGALFLAALLLRLSVLEAAPLSEREAAEAWGALKLLRGESSTSIGALYSTLTAALLFLTGPSHWAPRLIPALSGALAVFLPRIFLPARGRIEAFLAAVLIAASPTLWMPSTAAGSAALGFLAAGFCILYLRTANPRPILGGIGLGLAAASGPAGWSGLAVAAIAKSVEWIERRRRFPNAEAAAGISFLQRIAQFNISPAGLGGFLFGLCAGATGLFFFPRGFGALAACFTQWTGAFFSGLPRIGETALLLIAYDPVALVFGAAGIVMLWKGVLAEEDRYWGIFAVVAAVWFLLRPAALTEEAPWLILPLIVLGARALRSAIEAPVLAERPVFFLLSAGTVLVLAALTIINFAQWQATGSWMYLVFPWLAVFVFGLGFVVFRPEWRRDLRLMPAGLALGLACLLWLVQSGAGWNAVHARRNSADEFLWGEIVPADVVRLRETLEQISEWRTGVKDELAVVVLMPEESALGWELLAYSAVEYATTVDGRATPAMMIAPYAETEGAIVAPQLAAVYRGQSFAVAERRTWSGWPPDLIGWLLYREGPVERAHIVLWVRSDILVPEAKEEQ